MIFVYEVKGNLFIRKNKKVTSLPVGEDRELVNKVLKRLEKQGKVRYIRYLEREVIGLEESY